MLDIALNIPIATHVIIDCPCSSPLIQAIAPSAPPATVKTAGILSFLIGVQCFSHTPIPLQTVTIAIFSVIPVVSPPYFLLLFILNFTNVSRETLFF